MKHTMIESIAVHMHRCKNPECRRIVQAKENYFIDTLVTGSYCESCGKCLRYHRKKAIERGEKPPKTFKEVDARLNERMAHT
jgi:hypothetical protein